MRKWMLTLVGLGFFLIRISPAANPPALLGVVMGFSLGLLLLLLAAGAGAGFTGMLRQTRLDEQVLSVSGSSMLSDLVDEHPTELDPFLDGRMATQQKRTRGQADSTRHFEPVADLPQLEILTEYVR